jgi:D-hydroxyproline dehydrogenase subunit gamma
MSATGSGSVVVYVNGARADVSSGITVAAALLNVGQSAFRSSTGNELRGPVCGMGICYECRVTIDGVAHQRACLRLVADEMSIETAQVNAR